MHTHSNEPTVTVGCVYGGWELGSVKVEVQNPKCKQRFAGLCSVPVVVYIVVGGRAWLFI